MRGARSGEVRNMGVFEDLLLVRRTETPSGLQSASTFLEKTIWSWVWGRCWLYGNMYTMMLRIGAR